MCQACEPPPPKDYTPVRTGLATLPFLIGLGAGCAAPREAPAPRAVSLTTTEYVRDLTRQRDTLNAMIQQYETPPAAQAPTATIAANPSSITIQQRESSTLTWSSTDATGCTASGAWSGAKPTSGSQSVTPTATSVYSIACTGAGGTSPTQSATITVTTLPPVIPPVTGDGEWRELPKTALRPLCPANTSVYAFSDWCKNVILAWNGGAADTTRNRLLVWGGGHNDYFGNEIYAINIQTGTSVRLNNPSPPNMPMSTNNCVTTLADGAPNSRHIYGAIEYIAHRDEMIIFGGSLACAPGNFGNDTWTYSFKTNTWTNRKPSGPVLRADAGVVLVYHPTSRLVYVHDNMALYTYNPDTNVMALVRDNIHIDYHMQGTIDTKRNKLVIAGGPPGNDGGLWVYDLPAGTRTRWSTDPAVSVLAPGVSYDSALDRVVIWSGGKNVTLVNMDTRALSTQTMGGATPPPQPENGTFGRFRYFPALNLHAGVTDMELNTFTIAMGGTGTPPPAGKPSASLSANPATIVVPQSSTLTWSSTDATGCTKSGAWSGSAGPSGTQAVAPTATSTYSLACTGSGGTSPTVASTVTVSTTPVEPPSPGAIDITPGIFHVLDPPTVDGTGITRENKHTTWTYHPPSKRLYSVGGDFTGESYRQDTYSLSIAERWANKANVAAGWRLETPYCDATGGVQPKYPDYVGWAWDTKRSLFWMVPGTMVMQPAHLCPGETTAEASDPKYRYREVMTFDPTSKTWASPGIPPISAMITGDTWKSHYDATTDSVYQFGWSGAAGGTMNILNLGTRQNTVINLGVNAAKGDIRLFKEGTDIDPVARVIYGVDGIANRLMRFNIAARTITDLGPSPGQGMTDNNNALLAWDAKRAKLYYWSSGTNELWVYTPSTAQWTKPPQAPSDGKTPVRVRHAMVYDPNADVLAFLGNTETVPKLFFYRLPAALLLHEDSTGPPVRRIIKKKIGKQSSVIQRTWESTDERVDRSTCSNT